MDVILNKKIIHQLMKDNGFSTQNDLAKAMHVTKNQLSVILSGKFNPIKSNVQQLIDVLGEETLSAITPRKTTAKRHSKDDNTTEMDLFEQLQDEYVDVSSVVANRSYNVLELFAGAGGLALGLEEAGFNDVGLVELDKHAAATLRLNRPKWNVIEKDITEITSTKNGIFDYIPRDTEIDLLSGGYPCQAFSYAGKKQGLEDTRGTLFYHYAKIMEQVKPKMFLVENVKGLTTHDHGRTLKTMINVFENLGYRTTYRVLNAWNYGVAEKRERMVLVGIRQDLNGTYKFPKPHTYKPVLRDVLKNVPESSGQTFSAAKKRVLDLVPAGGYWRDLPDEIAKEYMGKSYFSGGGRTGMARRLSWDEPSLTLTTSPSQKQTERCHPDETRPFTTREYARIQSFPDDWQFSGGIGAIYKQIGNAVAVNFGKEVALSIVDTLNEIAE